jgi:hypothetical protein
MGREDNNQPVAAPEGFANFIVPLLRANDVRSTVPDRDSMTSQYPLNPLCETPVFCGVRQENFTRQGALLSGHSTSTYAIGLKAVAIRLLISAGLLLARSI